MYVVTVDVFVKPEALEPFLAAMKDNAHNSRLEPGCARFDIAQGEADPTHIFLYELYRTQADFEVHKTTAHFLRWRDAIADLLAKPSQSARHLDVDLTDDA